MRRYQREYVLSDSGSLWIAPAGVHYVDLDGYGSGAGGGAGSIAAASGVGLAGTHAGCGGGGGGGAQRRHRCFEVLPGNSYLITIPDGGLGGNGPSHLPGADGGVTSFDIVRFIGGGQGACYSGSVAAVNTVAQFGGSTVPMEVLYGGRLFNWTSYADLHQRVAGAGGYGLNHAAYPGVPGNYSVEGFAGGLGGAYGSSLSGGFVPGGAGGGGGGGPGGVGGKGGDGGNGKTGLTGPGQTGGAGAPDSGAGGGGGGACGSGDVLSSYGSGGKGGSGRLTVIWYA